MHVFLNKFNNLFLWFHYSLFLKKWTLLNHDFISLFNHQYWKSFFFIFCVYNQYTFYWSVESTIHLSFFIITHFLSNYKSLDNKTITTSLLWYICVHIIKKDWTHKKTTRTRHALCASWIALRDARYSTRAIVWSAPQATCFTFLPNKYSTGVGSTL